MSKVIELEKQLLATTDELEYDRISSALAAARKEANIEKAKQEAEIRAEQKAQRDKMKQEYQGILDQINSRYAQIEKLDYAMYDAVKAVSETATERFKLTDEIYDLEQDASSSAAALGVTFSRREAAFIGGRPLQEKKRAFIKMWLQRFEDWSNRLGRVPDIETISQHGLQSNLELDDQPWKY